ncbi:MAG: trypsin-like peptidase domain-containing protein [Actinomycetia bacterium]|nr:trypsin-like peptidase domain-containing protein [Actinomycetes bacterium]
MDTMDETPYTEETAPLTPAPPAPAPAQPAQSTPASTPWAVLIAVVVGVALIVGAAAGLGMASLGARWLAQDGGDAKTVRVVSGDTDEPVAAAAAAAVPSVVNIDITARVSSDTSDTGLPADHPEVPITGNGSGVAFRVAEKSTYIVTNAHVVSDASKITVTDSSGETRKAELIGADEETDIAVVKVDAVIPAIALGDSEKLVVGQMLVAIGSPYGLQHSVTSGVVSAIHRSLPDYSGTSNKYPLVDVIQTDAAINPGNSGGALVDRNGKLVGIPTAIFSNSGANDGIGFAVPVKTAMRVAGEIIDKGRAQHPFLGISGQTVTPELAAEKHLPVTEGAYVVEVSKGTEAEKAGIRAGDVVVKLDDTTIRSMDDLLLAVRRMSVGDTVQLFVWRDGKQIEIKMKVGVKPENL